MTFSHSSTLARWSQEAADRQIWEIEHPEEAATWNAALAEHEAHTEALANKAASEHAELSYKATFVERMTSMGVPLRITEALHAEEVASTAGKWFSATTAVTAARRFVAEKRSFLLLFGGVGSGKTCAACWTLLRARRRHVFDLATYQERNVLGELDASQGRFIRAAEAARISRFEDGGQWNRLLRVRFLVLDDIGVETVSDFWAERVNELLDARYGNRLPTALTSNLNADEFKRRYGDRIVSRIRDDGVVMGCGQEDLRGAA